MSRGGLGVVALAATLALACVRSRYPDVIVGEIVTQDGAIVDCPVRLWRGAIQPLDGRGEASPPAA